MACKYNIKNQKENGKINTIFSYLQALQFFVKKTTKGVKYIKVKRDVEEAIVS